MAKRKDPGTVLPNPFEGKFEVIITLISGDCMVWRMLALYEPGEYVWEFYDVKPTLRDSGRTVYEGKLKNYEYCRDREYVRFTYDPGRELLSIERPAEPEYMYRTDIYRPEIHGKKFTVTPYYPEWAFEHYIRFHMRPLEVGIE
ncbi:MAG: hypothetical protein LIO85_08535 [Rikenellaceae bacterium]|nr:hypothetical protein [Rikenellaceae bacterium]